MNETYEELLKLWKPLNDLNEEAKHGITASVVTNDKK